MNITNGEIKKLGRLHAEMMDLAKILKVKELRKKVYRPFLSAEMRTARARYNELITLFFKI